MSKSKKIIIFVGVIALLILAVSIYYIQGVSSVSKNKEDVVVTIENGQGVQSILETLDDAGLIKNRMCADIFLKLNHFTNLKANTYILNKGMNLNDIFSILEKPSSKYVLSTKITIKEGETIPEIVKTISKEMKLNEKDVLKELNDKKYLKSLIKEYWFLDNDILKDGIKYPLEGYLYPETYLLSHKDPTVKSFIEEALDMMDEKLAPLKEDIKKMNWSTHQFLTFSSIVERESLFDEDRPQIAGVFMNRLNTNMRLQSDITVNYAWQKTGVKVTLNQLTIDSPYNTYKYNGLPIGTISSVSLKTMKSCIYYQINDYLYFFAKKDGKVIYSKTLEEHNRAVKENKWY